jgi:predicted AAA+ superfamily ATPase
MIYKIHPVNPEILSNFARRTQTCRMTRQEHQQS